MSKSYNIAILYRTGQPGYASIMLTHKMYRTEYCQGWGKGGCLMCIIYLYLLLGLFKPYFLDELHERHKTIILSNVFCPPSAKLSIWSAVKSLWDPHLEQ